MNTSSTRRPSIWLILSRTFSGDGRAGRPAPRRMLDRRDLTPHLQRDLGLRDVSVRTRHRATLGASHPAGAPAA